MPILTFKCQNEQCGKEIEKIVPMRRVKDGQNLFINCDKCSHPAFEVLSVPSPMQWGCRRF